MKKKKRKKRPTRTTTSERSGGRKKKRRYTAKSLCLYVHTHTLVMRTRPLRASGTTVFPSRIILPARNSSILLRYVRTRVRQTKFTAQTPPKSTLIKAKREEPKERTLMERRGISGPKGMPIRAQMDSRADVLVFPVAEWSEMVKGACWCWVTVCILYTSVARPLPLHYSFWDFMFLSLFEFPNITKGCPYISCLPLPSCFSL